MYVLYIKNSKAGKTWKTIGVTKWVKVVKKIMDKYGYPRADWGYIESDSIRSSICSKSLRNFIDKNISE